MACLGHGVPEVVEAVAEQVRRVAYVSGMSFTNEPAEALADELAELALGDLALFYFLSSGSDAIEAALKLARQYWVERDRPAKSLLVALAPGYHGNTMLALSAGARDHYKRFFSRWSTWPGPALTRTVVHVRQELWHAHDADGRALEEALARLGPEKCPASSPSRWADPPRGSVPSRGLLAPLSGDL